MSMITCAYHLDEARTSIAVATDHLHKAESQDVDPTVAASVYASARTALHAVELYCAGLIGSRQPDINRERAEIDAERENGYER